jgi:hypothetical protein
MGADTRSDEEESCGGVKQVGPFAEGVSKGEGPPFFEDCFSMGTETVDSAGGRGDEDGEVGC